MYLLVVSLVAEERALFLREQANQMYSVWVYFLARTSIDLLPTALCSLGLALICFWMIGQLELIGLLALGKMEDQ